MGTGTLGTDDTNYRLEMAHAWLTHGQEIKPDQPAPTSRKNTSHGIENVRGQRVMFYDPGQSALMAPADWLGSKIAYRIHVRDSKGVIVWTVNWLVFLPLNVALILVAFWMARLLGYEERLAALSSMIWLIGTTVLPYAQVAFQNNQVLLATLFACAAIVKARRTGATPWLLASGAAAGFAVLLRASAGIHLVTVALLLLVSLRVERIGRAEAVRRILCWGTGALPPILAGRLFDYLRYGSPWVTGQSVWLARINSDPIFGALAPLPPGYPFINPAHEGILGVLVSPAKSLFLYDPLLLPCLIMGVLAWKTLSPYVRALCALAVLNTVLHIALTAKLDFWHGDWAWGARYHLSSIDLLLVFLLPLYLRRMLRATGAVAAMLRGLVLASIAVQLLAVAMPIGVEVGAENLQRPVICQEDEWNSKLGFRLGERVLDLYCLASGSVAARCPSRIAERAVLRDPQCASMARQLERRNHLAFFPFEPLHRWLGFPAELLLWSGFAILAGVLTLLWFARMARAAASEVQPDT